MTHAPGSSNIAPRPRPAIQFGRMLDGSAVLLDSHSGKTYAINATAAEVWELCDGRRMPDEIAAVLLERYEAAPGEVAGAVEALLTQLRHLGVLEPLSSVPEAATVASTLPHRRRYEMLGFSAEVASDSEDFLAMLDRFNTEFKVAGPGTPPAFYEALDYGDDLWELTFQGQELQWCRSLIDAVGCVERHMTDQAMDWQPELLHAHGAALAGPTSSVLLPGASNIGKTTFALALMLRGLRLYSDDVVFLEPDTWRPVPFPRTVHIHDDALAWLAAMGLRYQPEEHVGKYLLASALRPWPSEPGPPLRYILFPTWETGGPLALEPLTAAEAAVQLLRVSRNLRRRPRHGLDLLPRLLKGMRCYTLRRNDDLAAAAELVYCLVTEGEEAP